MSGGFVEYGTKRSNERFKLTKLGRAKLGGAVNLCIDCGLPTMGDLRCRKDNGRFIKLEAARQFDEDDRALLASGMSGQQVATQRGVSKQRGYALLRDARRRQAVLRSG